MNDFETHPVGTKKRIEALEAIADAAKKYRNLWHNVENTRMKALGEALAALDKEQNET